MSKNKINRRSVLSGLSLGIPGMLLSRCVKDIDNPYDLDNPEDNLDAFIKTRASLDGKDTVIWWSGEIHDFIPQKRSQKRFRFEGFSIARAVKVEGGYHLITREMSVYQNPETGKILETWDNPFTEQTDKIIHVWNDPVNSELLLQGGRVRFPLAYTDLGDRLCWPIDVFLTYPNPLPHSKYPELTASELYQGAELFQFYVEQEDLLDRTSPSAAVQISWTRIGQWLPWMRMGKRPGHLVYHCAGYKLKNGVEDLPHELRKFVETRHPEYLNTPDKFTRPNETSWTYYRKQLDKNP